MRTAMVDKEQVRELLKRGLSTTEIGRQMKCSGQNIRLIRKKFIEQGESFGKAKRVSGRVRTPKPRASDNGIYEWSDIQEAVLRMAQQAKGAEMLANENWQQKNRIGTLEELNAQLQRKLQEISGSQQAYDLLIKQGEIPTPLIRGKK